MVLYTFKYNLWLTAAAFGAVMASASHAQPDATAPAAASQALSPGTATPAAASASAFAFAKSGVGPSVFDDYKPYTDEPPGNWKAANNNVAQIGGWREYAKQAQQLENTPAPTNKAGEDMPKPATVPTTKAKP